MRRIVALISACHTAVDLQLAQDDRAYTFPWPTAWCLLQLPSQGPSRLKSYTSKAKSEVILHRKHALLPDRDKAGVHPSHMPSDKLRFMQNACANTNAYTYTPIQMHKHACADAHLSTSIRVCTTYMLFESSQEACSTPLLPTHPYGACSGCGGSPGAHRTRGTQTAGRRAPHAPPPAWRQQN